MVTASEVPATQEVQHVCRPGTGLYNTGLPGDRMPPSHVAATSVSSTSVMVGVDGPWPGYRPIPVGRHCNWTEPVATSIPDSNSRACTAQHRCLTGAFFWLEIKSQVGVTHWCSASAGMALTLEKFMHCGTATPIVQTALTSIAVHASAVVANCLGSNIHQQCGS